MALQDIGTLWTFRGRPCVVAGRGSRVVRKPGWTKPLAWNFHQVTFLDGKAPYKADIAEKEFSQRTKVIRGQHAVHFARIWELKQSGMLIGQAVQQARAELAKGIGQSDVVQV